MAAGGAAFLVVLHSEGALVCGSVTAEDVSKVWITQSRI